MKHLLMKGCSIVYVEHRNDIIRIVKLLEPTYDVLSPLK